MAENNNNDEYQFSELDGSQGFDDIGDSDNQVTATRAPSENNLKKFIGLGALAIIVLFIGYKFVLTFFHSSNKASTKASQTQQVKQIQTKPVVQQKPKVVEQTPPPTTFTQPRVETITKTVSDPAIKAKLNALESYSEQSNQKIKSLNNRLDSFTKAVNELNSKLTTMNSNMALMAQELQSQESYLNKLKAQALAKKRKKKKVTYKPRTIYHIQAIIPGRAWLISNQGSTITVVEGSAIPGYGTVSIIDPHQGHIILKSGKMIKFRVSDT